MKILGSTHTHSHTLTLSYSHTLTLSHSLPLPEKVQSSRCHPGLPRTRWTPSSFCSIKKTKHTRNHPQHPRVSLPGVAYLDINNRWGYQWSSSMRFPSASSTQRYLDHGEVGWAVKRKMLQCSNKSITSVAMVLHIATLQSILDQNSAGLPPPFESQSRHRKCT